MFFFTHDGMVLHCLNCQEKERKQGRESFILVITVALFKENVSKTILKTYENEVLQREHCVSAIEENIHCLLSIDFEIVIIAPLLSNFFDFSF